MTHGTHRNEAQPITGLLLAAGAGRRFGGSKLLAPLNGLPLLVHACRSLASCDRIVAVVRDGDEETHRLLQQDGVRMVINRSPDHGMGRSIAVGVAASGDSGGWCILPADMPFIQPRTTRVIVEALRNGAALAAPYHQGQRGHPVGFGRAFKEDLLQLHGELGARVIVEKNGERLLRLELDDPGILMDVDRPEDLSVRPAG
jgi:molybdenum cofactor cytidylyltransferase